MSGHTSTPQAFLAVARHGGGPLRAWARTLWGRLVLMRRAAETRRELGTLNPSLLANIGVTRAEASREAERWPWDLDPERSPGRGTGAHW